MEAGIEVRVGDIVLVPTRKQVGEIISIDPKGSRYEFVPTVSISKTKVEPLLCMQTLFLGRDQLYMTFSPQWRGVAINVRKARTIVQDALQKVTA